MVPGGAVPAQCIRRVAQDLVHLARHGVPDRSRGMNGVARARQSAMDMRIAAMAHVDAVGASVTRVAVMRDMVAEIESAVMAVRIG